MGWDARADLMAIARAALEAVDPFAVVPRLLPPRPKGRLVVVGAGKASARMALAAEQHYGAPLEGLVVTAYGHEEQTRLIPGAQARHPVPDEAGARAAARILDFARGLGEDDRLLVLLSGGGSALLALPAPGVSLEDKQAVTRALLQSGAPIAAINAVRRHLSQVKGGRLAAAAWPAETVTLAISDVPGDDPATIASGLTVADPSTLAEARETLSRYRIAVPERVRRALENPANETIKPGDLRLSRSRYCFAARPADALSAAGDAARARGYAVVSLGDRVEGEAQAVARDHAARIAALRQEGRAVALVSGGELTVTGAAGDAPGGRNREYLLALALGLKGLSGVAALAIDTDGIDGSKDAAGALIFPDTLARARARGLEPQALLNTHRSGEPFAALGDAVVTGPTRTNVGDLRVILFKP